MNDLSISASEILSYLTVVLVSIKYNNRQALATEIDFLREAYQIAPNEFQAAIDSITELVVALNQHFPSNPSDTESE